MIILNKTIENLSDLEKCVPETSCTEHIYNYIQNIIASIGRGTERIFTYDDMVDYALLLCKTNIPSPFSPNYPACYGLNLGNDFFTLRIPNMFGFGVKVAPSKGKIRYEISLIFYGNKCFVELSDYYKILIEDGWTLKEK